MRVEKKFNNDKIESIVLELSNTVNLVLTPIQNSEKVQILMKDKISNMMDLAENVSVEDIRQIVSALREIWISVNK